MDPLCNSSTRPWFLCFFFVEGMWLSKNPMDPDGSTIQNLRLKWLSHFDLIEKGWFPRCTKSQCLSFSPVEFAFFFASRICIFFWAIPLLRQTHIPESSRIEKMPLREAMETVSRSLKKKDPGKDGNGDTWHFDIQWNVCGSKRNVPQVGMEWNDLHFHPDGSTVASFLKFHPWSLLIHTFRATTSQAKFDRSTYSNWLNQNQTLGFYGCLVLGLYGFTT